jgi:hypothetical protein
VFPELELLSLPNTSLQLQRENPAPRWSCKLVELLLQSWFGGAGALPNTPSSGRAYGANEFQQTSTRRRRYYFPVIGGRPHTCLTLAPVQRCSTCRLKKQRKLDMIEEKNLKCKTIFLNKRTYTRKEKLIYTNFQLKSYTYNLYHRSKTYIYNFVKKGIYIIYAGEEKFIYITYTRKAKLMCITFQIKKLYT